MLYCILSSTCPGQGPVVFAQVKHGPGVDEIADFVIKEFKHVKGSAHDSKLHHHDHNHSHKH